MLHSLMLLVSFSCAAAMRVSPAFERNKGPILEALRRHLPDSQTGQILEVASGPGMHVAHWAAELPAWTFQPTEVEADMFASIQAYSSGQSNVLAPRPLDASDPAADFGAAGSFDAVVTVNLCHIAPSAATQGLLAGAGRSLRAGGRLCIYGPFLVDGKPTTPSNAEFDRSLRMRDPSWGIRDVGEIEKTAAGHSLVRRALDDMPSNNFFFVLEKQ